jgi:hypothetical protein
MKFVHEPDGRYPHSLDCLTIGELKTLIKDLPDDMFVFGEHDHDYWGSLYQPVSLKPKVQTVQLDGPKSSREGTVLVIPC